MKHQMPKRTVPRVHSQENDMNDSINPGAAQLMSASQTNPVSTGPTGEVGHCPAETPEIIADLATLIAETRQTLSFYNDYMRAKCRLELQIQAICRRLCEGDKADAAKLRKSVLNGMSHPMAVVAFGALAPMLDTRDRLEAQQKEYEKSLVRLAKQMPVYEWAQGVRGLGDASLGKLIGEIGDLGQYSNPAKVWKRMGMAVIDGGRQRRVSGEKALDHGYSPTRRSLVWTIGDCMIRAGVRKGKEEGDPSTALGEYGQLYLDRKAYEAERVETAAHAHNRAKRYMEKRMLRDLWRAWRDA